MNYGPNPIELWKRAASFVDRIFNGAKPADLPVEQPTKFELVINLKTAKALGVTVPPALLGRRRRGNRIKLAMSAIGTKRTLRVAPHMSAIGGKADMPFCTANVRL